MAYSRCADALRIALAGLLLTGSLIAGVETCHGGERTADHWPQWRGPQATGMSRTARPPLEWSETENVAWKVAIPGKGHSTPIVWGDRLFLTTAVPVGEALEPRYSGAPGAHDNAPVTHRHEFVVICVDRKSGGILWEKKVHEALPHEGAHYTASLASASPVTDGKHVYAFFGSYGLYCLDFEGNVVWQKDLGRQNTKHGHGEGSSPALYDDTLVVNWDHEGQSVLYAIDATTGAPRWKVERDEVTSWATPLVVEHDGRAQVVVSGTDRVRGYDLEDGRVIWQCGGLSANIVASPVAGNGMVFAGSSYEKRALLAIRLEGAKGDISGTDNVVWSVRRGTPYVPSLLLTDEGLYYLAHYQGILTRLLAATGQPAPGAMRLGAIGDVYASPVAADGRVYITDRRGTTMVITDGAEPEVLAVNQLGDSFSASAALAGNQLFLRGEKYLYCLAEVSDEEPSRD